MNVENNKFKLLLAASAVSLALTGCGGSDGNDGEDGKPGGPAAETIETLNLNITQVTYDDGQPTIEVMATNEDGLAVVGLTAFEVKKAAQLSPQGASGAGDSANWHVIGSQKEFTDNKDGSYTFTIPVEGYNSELTQRFNLIAAESTLQDGITSVPRTEFTQDFSGDGYQALYTKNVVSTASCSNCHAEGVKIYHSYTTSESCASCHTQDMADDKGKPHVAYAHLVHNVHNSAKGYGDNDAVKAHDIVQDNCQNCHVEPVEGDTSLTEWGNWSNVPTMETCTSCHVNIDFKAGKGHSQQDNNSNCIACHNANWTEEIHLGGFSETKALIDSYGLSTALTVNADDTVALKITFLDSEGAAIEAAELIPQIQRLEATTNVGPNHVTLGYKGKDSLNLIKNGVLDEKAAITEDGRVAYTTEALAFGAAGEDSDTAFSFIGLSLCSDKGMFVDCDTVTIDGNFEFNWDGSKYLKADFYTGMKADLAFASKSGEAVSVRHTDSINFDTCISCHGDTFEIHKGGYHPGFVMTEQLGRENADGEIVIGVDGCVSCHTPDGTYAGGGNQGALEMKLHKVHGFGQYASSIQGIQCSQCHNDFNTGAFKNKGALASDSGVYTTPIAATCMSCHAYSPDALEKFKLHAEGQGAIVNGTYEAANDAAQLESCFSCHKPEIDNHTSVKL